MFRLPWIAKYSFLLIVVVCPLVILRLGIMLFVPREIMTVELTTIGVILCTSIFVILMIVLMTLFYFFWVLLMRLVYGSSRVREWISDHRYWYWRDNERRAQSYLMRPSDYELSTRSFKNRFIKTIRNHGADVSEGLVYIRADLAKETEVGRIQRTKFSSRHKLNRNNRLIRTR